MGTPLEKRPSEFVLIETLTSGDQIMATGVDLKWSPATVEDRSGDVDQLVIPGLLYVEYAMPGEDGYRHLLVTPDHPFLMQGTKFLMQGTKKLKKVQHLEPGDKLATPDGDAAIVQFVHPGEHFTTIQSIEMVGDVDPQTLDGHLLNSNGVVTADYAVQVMVELGHGEFDRISHEPDSEEMECGRDEYIEMHGAASQAFVDDPARWPRGFVPHHSAPNVVPGYAYGYLTKDQAEAVYNNAEFNPFNNVTGRADMLYLFRLSRAQFPDIVCILDWQQRVPNAYSWQNSGQKFLLVTGGLVRLKKFYIDGLSMIVASLQASLQGQECVCQWDYAATTTILRVTWPDTVLATLIPDGISQVQSMFDKAGKDVPGDDPCNLPTLKCRIESYWAGFSFLDLPDCAGVWPRYLEIGAAIVTIDNKQIEITFNDRLDSKTVADLNNYELQPEATITAAKVSTRNPKTAVLDVDGLEGPRSYVLLLKDLLSVNGAQLGPDQRKVIITAH